MGDRAVITTRENYENDGIGVYLHWNGDRDSIQGFLTFCKRKGYRSPTEDNSYGFARLAQVIANFFGGNGLSVGVDKVSNLDTANGDNGVYIIDGWDIVDRYFSCYEKQNDIVVEDMIREINRCQPEDCRISV